MRFREWVELEDFIHIFIIAASCDISAVISSQRYHQKFDKPDTGVTHGLFIHHDAIISWFDSDYDIVWALYYRAIV